MATRSAPSHADAQGSRAHANQLRTTFDEFDRDGSGTISQAELKAALRKLYGDEELDEDIDAQVHVLMTAVDENADGELDFAEFVQLAWLLNLAGRDITSNVAHFAAMSGQQHESSSDAVKLLQVLSSFFFVYVAIVALDAGSFSDLHTCLPESDHNATDPTTTTLTPDEIIRRYETQEDWRDLRSAVRSWALMTVINSASTVVHAWCGHWQSAHAHALVP